MAQVVGRTPRPLRTALATPIAEVAEIFGLTARALRHYEDRGLLTSHRDKSNRRTYGPAERAVIQVIADLRAADVPIPEIEALLREAAPESETLAAAIAQRLRLSLAALDARRAALAATLQTYETDAARRRSAASPSSGDPP